MGASLSTLDQPRLLWQDLFCPVLVSSLRVDTVTDFDLYVHGDTDAPPVLYRERNLPFTEQSRRRLIDNAVTRLYVPNDQSRAYHRYVEANLHGILADETVPVEERSSVLYSSSISMVKSLLAEPRAGDLLPRSRGMVENTVGFIFHQKAAITSLLKVTSYDYYTYTHSMDVLIFSIGLGRRMGFGEADLKDFGTGALLHDIGKSMIDQAILNCPGKLNEEQWRIMKQHPVYSYNILCGQGVTSPPILDVTRHHHEKLNGKGYPDGLRAKDISAFVRISTVADIFDALTTRRSYKDAMQSFEALRLMKSQMRDELDPGVFQTFVEMMGNPG